MEAVGNRPGLQGECRHRSVLADMRRIDALMSTYKPDSEISRVTDNARRKHRCRFSIELFAATNCAAVFGAFLPGRSTSLGASVGYLYITGQHQRPDAGRRLLAALTDRGLPPAQTRQPPTHHCLPRQTLACALTWVALRKVTLWTAASQILNGSGVSACHVVNAGGDYQRQRRPVRQAR